MTIKKLTTFLSTNFGMVVIAILLLPFVILGPFSLIQNHDNADGIMPLMIVAAEHFPNLPGWFPYSAGGAPLFAQGIPLGPLTALFGILPVWPGYIVIFLIQATAGGVGIYLFCKEYLGIQKFVGIMAAVLTIFQSSSALLIITPVLLAPFSAWLVLKFTLDQTLTKKVLITIGCGLFLGCFSSSYLAISFWFLVGPAIIFIGSKKLSDSILLSLLFLFSSLVPIAHEIAALVLNMDESQRSHNGVYPNLTVLEFVLRFLSSPFLLGGLLLFFAKNKTVYVNKAFILYFLLAITILITLFTNKYLVELGVLLNGFNYTNLLNPLMFLGIVCASAFVSSFRVSENKYFSPLLIIVFLAIPLADKYTRYIADSARSWVVAGNSERFTIPQIEAIALDAQSEAMPYRVDMVNFPLGSGFLSAYKLESAGGYLNMYPNRYRNFFADAVTPEVNGLPTPSRNSVLNWGNRLNFTCDFIYEGVLEMDKCMNMDLIALLNIRYLISRNPMRHANLKLVDGPDKPWNLLTTRKKIQRSVEENFGARELLFIFELKQYAPRAFVVDKMQVASNEKELSDLLRAATLKSLLNEVILLRDDLIALPDKSRKTLENATNSKPLDVELTDLQFSGDLFKINVESNKPGILVVTNSLAVGWHATVNAETVEILPAYGTFWGIPVIEGSNDVRLEYESYTSTTDLLGQIKRRITTN